VVRAELQICPRSGWIFPAAGHVSRHTVSSGLPKAMKRAGIQHRPHQFRAWHATEFIESAAATIIAAAPMRHSDMQSISKYVKMLDEQLRAAMERLLVIEVPERSGWRAA